MHRFSNYCHLCLRWNGILRPSEHPKIYQRACHVETHKMMAKGIRLTASIPGTDFEGRGAQEVLTPSMLCRDWMPDFVWVLQANRMHKIARTGFENYIFSLLLRGTSPLDTSCPHRWRSTVSSSFGCTLFKKILDPPLYTANYTSGYLYLEVTAANTVHACLDTHILGFMENVRDTPWQQYLRKFNNFRDWLAKW